MFYADLRIYDALMKRFQPVLLALILALPGSAYSDEGLTPNLIAEGRHMPDLNEQTFGDTDYVIPPAPEDATQFAFTLKGYVFGLRLIKANYRGYETEREYAAYTDLRTSGLGALLKSLDIWSVTRGRMTDTGQMRPDVHLQQNTNEKNRRVEMVYNHSEQRVDVAIDPPLGSQGEPPATPEERYGAFDTVSILLHMARKGRLDPDALCRDRLPVFDSKQHYNLRFEPVGTDRVKFLDDRQSAIHCHAFYEPVSGFDPEDRPSAEEAGTPIDVYFKYFPETDMHVPVRFTYKISGFTAVIKMTELTFITPDGTRIERGD
jgi:hypothetical protein